MKKRIRKNDLIFLGILAALVLVIYIVMTVGTGRGGEAEDARVEITVDCEVFGVYPLLTVT